MSGQVVKKKHLMQISILITDRPSDIYITKSSLHKKKEGLLNLSNLGFSNHEEMSQTDFKVWGFGDSQWLSDLSGRLGIMSSMDQVQVGERISK